MFNLNSPSSDPLILKIISKMMTSLPHLAKSKIKGYERQASLKKLSLGYLVLLNHSDEQ